MKGGKASDEEFDGDEDPKSLVMVKDETEEIFITSILHSTATLQSGAAPSESCPQSSGLQLAQSPFLVLRG
jgi:hypothetical protein